MRGELQNRAVNGDPEGGRTLSPLAAVVSRLRAQVDQLDEATQQARSTFQPILRQEDSPCKTCAEECTPSCDSETVQQLGEISLRLGDNIASINSMVSSSDI